MKPFISRTEKTPFKAPGLRRHLPGQIVRETPLSKSVAYMKSLQRTDGYWWFALEANETIGAEFIFLMNYLGAVDEEIQKAIARRILDVQRPDGTWAIYNDGPGCISTTLECYLALKIAGLSVDDPRMARAREFILSCGGAEKVRVFTKIHLAMFGLVPWEATPAMPVEYILMPHWAGCSIYEFSSWARATIVPLLIFMSFKKVQKLKDGLDIEELFCNPSEKRTWRFKTTKGLVSWENFFINLDKCLKVYEKFPLKPLRKLAISKCSEWTWEHVKKTEDIYPALAYGALAFKAMGYSLDSPEIRKPFEALRMFHQCYTTKDLAALPDEVRDDGRTRPSELRELGISPRIASGTPRMAGSELRIHQQCCISPVWDTPWMVISLLEAGCPASDPALLRAGRWLMRKQITDVRGDWAVKNPGGKPGGWSFEFENDYFPDVDDTIEVLTVLDRLAIPWNEKSKACRLGLEWLLSMQNKDGGWGAFDKNQTFDIVNRIPFSDHGACLDPSSPDITGRMVEFLVSQNFSREHSAVRRALAYIAKTQSPFGGWWARWGVNYLYGTWCVLTGLASAGRDLKDPAVAKAVAWLESVQRPDGGFGESPESYAKESFVEWKRSVPSQTAWALMALVAAGAARSAAARGAAKYLLDNRNEAGGWDEEDYTGTGFQNHFYIRYHGYRHFFPLLALARFFRTAGGFDAAFLEGDRPASA